MGWIGSTSSLWFRLSDSVVPEGIEDHEPPAEMGLGHCISVAGKAHSKR